MHKTIKFKKWIDPFLTNYHNLNDASTLDESDEYLPYEDEEFLEPKSDGLGKLNVPVLHTPIGPLPLVNQAYPSKVWNMWVGHTNFDITPAVVSNIEKTEGVEMLLPLSRYRFQIGIGLIFNTAKVLSEITKTLCGNLEQEIKSLLGVTSVQNFILDDKHLKLIETTKKNLSKKYWAIYVFPNGHIKAFQSDVIDDELSDKINEICTLHMKCGGAVYSSFLEQKSEI